MNMTSKDAKKTFIASALPRPRYLEAIGAAIDPMSAPTPPIAKTTPKRAGGTFSSFKINSGAIAFESE